MAALYPSTTKVFFEESKEARESINKLLDTYRENTTKVLALATGALTLFGIEDSSKGAWFLVAIIAYGLAAIAAIGVYSPVKWQANVAHDMVEREDGPLRTTDPIFEMQASVAQYFLGRGHQIAIKMNLERLMSWRGPARRFQACLVLSAVTIIAGGLNLWVDRDQSATPSEPIEVVLVDKRGDQG